MVVHVNLTKLYILRASVYIAEFLLRPALRPLWNIIGESTKSFDIYVKLVYQFPIVFFNIKILVFIIAKSCNFFVYHTRQLKWPRQLSILRFSLPSKF